MLDGTKVENWKRKRESIVVCFMENEKKQLASLSKSFQGHGSWKVPRIFFFFFDTFNTWLLVSSPFPLLQNVLVSILGLPEHFQDDFSLHEEAGREKYPSKGLSSVKNSER